MMCVPPYEYMAPPYEYVENSRDTSDSQEEENHNTWNMLLKIQQGRHDWELCRVALSFHFALDTNCKSMERQAGERLRHAQTQCELPATKRETDGEAAVTWI